MAPGLSAPGITVGCDKERLRQLAEKETESKNERCANERCAMETLQPWLIGIVVMSCMTIGLAFYYADDIRQAQKKKVNEAQQATPGQGQGHGGKAAGMIPAASPLGQLAAFVPPWHSQPNPAAVTGATPVALVFSKAIRRVSPSVVGICTTGIREQSASGIIIHPMGYILTNYHVVKDAKNIGVTVAVDQMIRNYSAEIVEVRPEMDLAMIRLLNVGGERFVPAPLGDSDRLVVGQQVVAIGSPFGLAQSASAGIISNTDRTLTAGDRVFSGLMQTDASINPGSSGGALVSTRSAEVIGINTAIYSPTMSFSGIGFAIPINRAKRVFAPFMQSGKTPAVDQVNTPAPQMKVNNPAPVQAGGGNMQQVGVATRKTVGKPCWLGIDAYPMNGIMARELDVPFHGGVLVNRVFQASPAGLADLRRGDVLFRIDGRRIKSQDMLWAYLGPKQKGDRVELTLFRNGRKQTVLVQLEPEPANVHDLLAQVPSGRATPGLPQIQEISWLGIDIWPIDPDQAAQQFGLDPATPGVLVGQIEGIAAINAGLQPGDVLQRINNVPIKDLEAFKQTVTNVDPTKGVMLDILRKNRAYYITIHSANRNLGAWQ